MLKSHAKEPIATLEEQIWMDSAQELFNEHTPDALNVLLESIAAKKQVTLQYQTSYAGELTDKAPD